MSKILVTGGCGYIGSHTLVDLIDNGFEVISIDNHTNSSADILENVKDITGKTVHNYNVDLTDLAATKAVFAENTDLVGVIHFAALKAVGESVEQPLRYFHNNLTSLLNVLTCMQEFEVKNLIFSSSCSVYGNTDALPVVEDTPFQLAESPYARTKQMGEDICRDFCVANSDFNIILLRYFNPAGAHASGKLGEAPTANVSNLVPVIMETAVGKRKELVVFGDDYDTRDGSCIRDYIHVEDLANAHTKSLQYLVADKNEENCEVFNVGIGQGVSVLEAIKAFEKVTNQKLNYRIGGRRSGDVIAIYANPSKAAEKLGWQPQRDIESIMSTAWTWENVRYESV